MKPVFWVIPLVAMALTGCGNSVKKTLGMERTVPDEFSVVERAPLVMPPNFELAIPRPGAPRPQEMTGEARAEAVILGQAATLQSATPQSTGASAGENALLSNIGTRSDPNIRTELRHAADDSKAVTFKEKIGISTPEKGTALDPVEEAEKLKQKNINTSGAISTDNTTETGKK